MLKRRSGHLWHKCRNRHIRWIRNAKIDGVEAGAMTMTEVDEGGADKRERHLDLKHAMIMRAFLAKPKSMFVLGDLLSLAIS